MKKGDKVKVVSCGDLDFLQKNYIGQVGTIADDDDELPLVCFDDSFHICFHVDKLIPYGELNEHYTTVSKDQIDALAEAVYEKARVNLNTANSLELKELVLEHLCKN